MGIVKDLDKRRRVMQRSMQLGHCICDPRKPCPCNLLLEQDLCPCAGEEQPLREAPIRLTEWVESCGCASKIDQAALQRILAGLPVAADPRVLVGMPAGDDAGVYLLDERTALVQTVDVFTPPVDDPYAFGQIAAANSLSDVYAMGGRPITALSIVGFPAGKLPDEVLRQILRGGLDKMTEAGVAVIGGHSIKENEIKAGFAVTGLIDPRRISTNAAARPGDRLVLTKPLGTGIIAFAARIGRARPESAAAALRWMTALNRRAAELMGQFEAHACTDVTGFGLLGHLKSMAAASKVDVELAWEGLPLLPGVLDCLSAGIVPGSVERNRESSGDALAAIDGVDPAWIDILFDAQTSGGLLISLPGGAAEALAARLRAEGMEEASVVGRVVGEGTGRITVRGRDGRGTVPIFVSTKMGLSPLTPPGGEVSQKGKETDTMSCCGGDQDPSKDLPAAADDEETRQKFHAFLEAANAPGALGARTKRAMAIALSVLARCDPCLKHHVRKAKEEGFSAEEIEEAAWMAVAFGGCPTMMFYNERKPSQFSK
jgi:selenide,water dikinase